MCSIAAYDKLLPTYIDDASSDSGSGRAMPNNSATAALK